MMHEQRNRFMLFIVLSILLQFSSAMSNQVWACRLLEPPAEAVDVLWVHLEGFCFSGDQREWAVTGKEVLEALETGKNIDIQGALILGDIMLDQLPLQPIREIRGIPQHIQMGLQETGLEKVRIIPGSISILDSQFENVFATNLVHDTLIILGEVNVSGTTFLQSVDFSKIIFVKPVVFSNVNVEYEGFFIGAQFENPTDFSHTTFGTHSRFHKAVFQSSATFADVVFKGVAEFLEVKFMQTAHFSNVKFLSGTGFSGSVFHGPANFSGIQTQQEVYFRFSEFRDDVTFRHGRFQSVLDFANSTFEGTYDFSEAEFAIQPGFRDSNISIEVPIIGQTINRQAQWFIFALLVTLAGIYLLITRRRVGDSSS